MNLAEKKETLLHIVQDADDKLTGLLIALANEYNDVNNSYSTEELNFFSSRQKAFFDNDKKGSTIEEVHDRIRRKHIDGI